MRHYSRAEMEQIYDSIVGQRILGAPPQTPLQETTDQRYVVGSKREFPDGRAFRYSWAATALRQGWGGQDGAAVVSTTLNSGAQVAGRTLIIPDGGTTWAVNHFQNGYVAIENIDGAGLNSFFSRILSSTLSDGTHVTLTLEWPLPNAVATENCTIVSNPWATVTRMMETGAPQAKLTTVVGIPVIPITALRFFWAQIRGPIAGIPVAFFGGTEFERRVEFHDTDGSMRVADFTGQEYQHAGWLMGSHAAIVNPRNVMVWLEIC